MSGRDKLIAALLTMALLFCHGALGALHQAASWPADGEGVQHHAFVAAPSVVEHHSGHHGDPMAHADYAAVPFVVLLGATLALSSVGLVARGLAVAPRFLWRVFLPLFLRPPRGPTLQLLQVFQL